MIKTNGWFWIFILYTKGFDMHTKKHTIETRQKISDSLKKYYAETQTEEQRQERIKKIKDYYRRAYFYINGLY